MSLKDYYETLEVSPNASEEVIKNAYRALAKKWHPDSKSGREKQVSENKLKEINLAYEELSDPVKKQEYDRNRTSFYKGNFNGNTYQAKSETTNEPKSNSNQESKSDSETNGSSKPGFSAESSKGEQQSKNQYNNPKPRVAEHSTKNNYKLVAIVFIVVGIFWSYISFETANSTPPLTQKNVVESQTSKSEKLNTSSPIIENTDKPTEIIVAQSTAKPSTQIQPNLKLNLRQFLHLLLNLLLYQLL